MLEVSSGASITRGPILLSWVCLRDLPPQARAHRSEAGDHHPVHLVTRHPIGASNRFRNIGSDFHQLLASQPGSFRELTPT